VRVLVAAATMILCLRAVWLRTSTRLALGALHDTSPSEDCPGAWRAHWLATAKRATRQVTKRAVRVEPEYTAASESTCLGEAVVDARFSGRAGGRQSAQFGRRVGGPRRVGHAGGCVKLLFSRACVFEMNRHQCKMYNRRRKFARR
jgi:hypothetical protein